MLIKVIGKLYDWPKISRRYGIVKQLLSKSDTARKGLRQFIFLAKT